MKINKDHMYHGAALTQVAEHHSFKAINAVRSDEGVVSRSAFLINTDVGLFLKYATKSKGRFKEFVFTFHTEHLEELENLKKKTKKVYISLVCVAASQICCLPYEIFLKLIAARKRSKGIDEESYTILVTVPAGKSFRAYVSPAGKKKVALGTEIISRDDFPDMLF